VTQQQRNKSQTRTAIDGLKELIFSGELPPGSDHLETELATRLGMSRTPVREATLMLEGQGLLEVRPRKGVRILSLSISDMDEIYELLTELESLAARRAASASYSDEDLQYLAQAIIDMEAALEKEDREAWARADEAFHTELVRLGGNSRVISIVSNFNDQVRRARAMTLYIRPLPEKSNEDHRALLEAISEGNAELAFKVHHEHRSNARKMLIELMQKHGLRHV
jgi:DNA-binding GntR family transcriptional regulator